MGIVMRIINNIIINPGSVLNTGASIPANVAGRDPILKFNKYLSFIEKIADIPNHSSYNNYCDHVYGDLVAPD